MLYNTVMNLGPYLLGPNATAENGIYTGDARLLAEAIPDNSIDLIFTDPPYPKEYLPLYGWLAETAARVLKPGGSLFAMSGGYWFLEVLDLMRPHLDYHWLCCMYQPSVNSTFRSFPKRLDVYWKPILWFTKGKYTGPFLADGINTSIPDKRFHKWGQPERWAFTFLERFRTDVVILDPFVGGGTVPATCKMLGRHRWLAFEIEPDVAERARQRVRDTQPPLPIIMPSQLGIELVPNENGGGREGEGQREQNAEAGAEPIKDGLDNA